MNFDSFSEEASTDSDDTRVIKFLVHLACSKRSVRLSKGSKRKTWCPTVSDCLMSFVNFAEVC